MGRKKQKIEREKQKKKKLNKRWGWNQMLQLCRRRHVQFNEKHQHHAVQSLHMQSTNLSAYISWDAKSLSIGQSKHLVVIQHAVQVLNPLWVHIPIKDDPLSLVELTTHIVNDPGRMT